LRSSAPSQTRISLREWAYSRCRIPVPVPFRVQSGNAEEVEK
jgi:hypothetical protein